jgi:hypothetical protein
MKVSKKLNFADFGRSSRGMVVASRAARAAKLRNPYLFETVERIKERAKGLTSNELYTEAKYLSDLYEIIHVAVSSGEFDRTLIDLVEMDIMTLDARTNRMAVLIRATADFHRKRVSKLAMKLETAVLEGLTPSEFRLTLRDYR